MIETNVLGLMRMTRLCVPALVDGGGHIVNLGSVAGIWSYPSGSSYVASKFAVHGYTRALRDDLQGKPVRITNVAPGLVETNFSNVRFKGDEEKAAAVYANVALGGPLHAEDVADCIMFALTRPPHVNIDEIVVLALAQVSGANVVRDELGVNRASRIRSPALGRQPLVPVAAQAVPGLPERRDLVVDVGVGAEVGLRCRDELLLVHAVAHARGPAVELLVEAVEMRADVLVHPEMDQARAAPARARGSPHGRVPGLDIDVGRR